jgi:hypothetical protein
MLAHAWLGKIRASSIWPAHQTSTRRSLITARQGRCMRNSGRGDGGSGSPAGSRPYWLYRPARPQSTLRIRQTSHGLDVRMGLYPRASSPASPARTRSPRKPRPAPPAGAADTARGSTSSPTLLSQCQARCIKQARTTWRQWPQLTILSSLDARSHPSHGRSPVQVLSVASFDDDAVSVGEDVLS